MIAALLFVAALAADPVVAAPATAASAASPVADTDLREFAAIAGRKVVGRAVGGPYATADKVLLIARDEKGFPVIAASIGFPSRQSLPPPPPATLAVVRLHQRSETIVPGPTPDDLAFVAANKLPLFVIGEWARPAPMWEVAWVDDAVRYRAVGDVGEIGPWQD
ncbi:hypothetical protein SKP52_04775 [Sphingopyxis fribergensis]|uniref:Secreted protein n=1 Tax=Sphingopyxis fribergensis TaxID=1515612 RepID=A0A0A7PIX2_9SPHN|nr:hypothetical protein [Sphingopyxis fribergensis]AJA07882.1 hypothetical protein SKP52_04775 [Sphingopyxis fribergensis]